jgi:uncharacterized membrane protein YgdD (TMEM256/DUF423 family)
VSRTMAAALLGSSGVAMGAFGAHALKVRALLASCQNQ